MIIRAELFAHDGFCNNFPSVVRARILQEATNNNLNNNKISPEDEQAKEEARRVINTLPH